jgi:hypothetical protein
VPTAITICLYFRGPQLFRDRVLLRRTHILRSPQAGKLLPPGGILEDPEEKIWQKGEKIE